MMSNRFAIVALLVFVSTPEAAGAPAATTVLINGEASPVHFNDGDSFRVLAGKYQGTKARLGGYNTLESHGPVHQWHGWTYKEMYVNAKMATLFARQRVWECTTEWERDTYGRVLMFCDELAEALIRRGLAHTMTVTAEPGKASYLEAQRLAIQERRGMWAHGVPDYILTSLHSVEERPEEKFAYNRAVSTVDGHSEKWEHTDAYGECEKVCVPAFEIAPTELERAAEALQPLLEGDAATWFAASSDADKLQVLRVWGMIDSVAQLVPKAHRSALRAALVNVGDIEKSNERADSCQIYVKFERRFGGNKAECLK